MQINDLDERGVGGRDEPFSDGALDLFTQRAVEAVDYAADISQALRMMGGLGRTVQHDNGPAVDPELVPRDHLHDFFECAEAAGEDDEATRRELCHTELSLG